MNPKPGPLGPDIYSLLDTGFLSTAGLNSWQYNRERNSEKAIIEYRITLKT